jgi:hypothetical protein
MVIDINYNSTIKENNKMKFIRNMALVQSSGIKPVYQAKKLLKKSYKFPCETYHAKK